MDEARDGDNDAHLEPASKAADVKVTKFITRARSGLRRHWRNVELALARLGSRRGTRRCSICDHDVLRFVDGYCPFCRSLPRHRLIAYAFTQLGQLAERPTVVHLGANALERRWVEAHVRPATYHRVDILPTQEANLVADAASLPLPDQSADLAVAWHVLEHIPRDQEAIAELFRVLRVGACLVVSVPIYPKGRTVTFEDPTTRAEDRERVYGFHEHVRACGTDYGERLARVGFEVTTLAIARRPNADIVRFGLSDGHYAWICRKPIEASISP